MIAKYLAAGYPILAVKTSEPDRTQAALSHEAGEDYSCYSWDTSAGLKDLRTGECRPMPAPLAPLTWLTQTKENTILFVWNFHRCISSLELTQALQNARDIWKGQKKCLIILCPDILIPVEIEKSITILNFTLPDRTELLKILVAVAKAAKIDIPADPEPILSAATGLTVFEAENAFCLSFAMLGRFDPAIITEQKAQMVKRNASLDYAKYPEKFADIGGLDNLKDFCLGTIASPLSRGVMLLGVPGTGKSMFAKALGNEANLPTLSLDFGRLFGSFIGQSEQQTREALAVVDAMAPCILFIDEIEKGLSGTQSSHLTDGGTGSRVFGSFLTWLNDHTSKVFVIATCNDITKIPPEFLRAERWDAIFFVDLPTHPEQAQILNLYQSQYQVQGNPPDMTGWTGAEIRSLCRIAAMMKSTLSEAAQYVIPLSRSMGEKIEELREWAKGRCIPASRPETIPAVSGRKLKRGN